MQLSVLDRGVVGLGVAAGVLRRKGERGGEGGHYFLAGNTLTWPVIGLAMFAANISTVAELVVHSEADLLKVRSFGKTTLREVKRKLLDLGLSLGMELPAELQASNA